MWAVSTAWMSPVKWRLIVVGRHELRAPAPGPAALDAEARADRGLAERDDGPPADAGQSACPSPIVTVVFPSPGGVGVMEETTTSLPDGASRRAPSALTGTFAISRP